MCVKECYMWSKFKNIRKEYTQFSIVEEVEKHNAGYSHLSERSNAHFLWLHVLVLPTPESYNKNMQMI